MSNYNDPNNFYFQESQRRAAENIRKQSQINDLSRLKQNEEERANRLSRELENTKNYYKKLLSKPMEEIAEVNGNFKATFEKQQEIIADWIVSQKAFRELAYEFGEKLGLSQDQVREMVPEKEREVLNNETKYGSNISDNIHNEELIEKLKSKL